MTAPVSHSPAQEAAPPAVAVSYLTHRYGERIAVDTLSFEVERATITAILGPNGSGKTTLFRILSTLARPQTGDVYLGGVNLRSSLEAIRRTIGVVFQSPSLDKKLTVLENLRHQAALYGMRRERAAERIKSATTTFGLQDRLGHLVETLSGGLQRRVELAKALLHEPSILLLDEPSTGLDPGARADLRETLERLRRESEATILLTTHLIEEADFADRVLILHEGKLVADGTPQALRASVGGEVITLRGGDAEAMRQRLVAEGFDPRPSGADLRVQTPEPATAMARILPLLGEAIHEVTIGRPTLADLFFARTGRLLAEMPEPDPVPAGKKGSH